MKLFAAALLTCYALTGHCTIIEVGKGKTYQRLQQAAAVAVAGDTIMLFAGVYPGGDVIKQLHGNASAWITIMPATGNEVVYRGKDEALHISEVSYISIEGLIFEQQTGNGVNVDDGGNEKNTHHIRFERCRWRNMNAIRNNDELKLSGIDDFIIKECRFSNGASGGSLVDMVGCHRGIFSKCVFENAGSNAIQAKGGSCDIIITQSRFMDCGQRAINIGGSTNPAYFRPAGANYEAKHILVQSNIFTGAMASVAFVGAVECAVENNTFYLPGKWVVRILQENTAAGFLPCSNNTFSHNIVVYANAIKDPLNIGPGTNAETFKFSYNLWYRRDNAALINTHTQIQETNSIFLDPLFADTSGFKITQQSPARQAGSSDHTTPELDFYGRPFLTPRSIGAVEFGDFP